MTCKISDNSEHTSRKKKKTKPKKKTGKDTIQACNNFESFTQTKIVHTKE